ncbi:MAG: twin-arginine translocation signal domain-containing protein [Nanoarchaeales archaeon]|nr:twin-arginine translocation signal domain-containing protein [Nanoarchaeales archaeon]
MSTSFFYKLIESLHPDERMSDKEGKKHNNKTISRRNFLKGAAAVTLGTLLPTEQAKADFSYGKTKKVIIKKYVPTWIQNIEDPLLKKLYTMLLNGLDMKVKTKFENRINRLGIRDVFKYEHYKVILLGGTEDLTYSDSGKVIKISNDVFKTEPLYHILMMLTNKANNLEKYSRKFMIDFHGIKNVSFMESLFVPLHNDDVNLKPINSRYTGDFNTPLDGYEQQLENGLSAEGHPMYYLVKQINFFYDSYDPHMDAVNFDHKWASIYKHRFEFKKSVLSIIHGVSGSDLDNLLRKLRWEDNNPRFRSGYGDAWSIRLSHLVQYAIDNKKLALKHKKILWWMFYLEALIMNYSVGIVLIENGYVYNFRKFEKVFGNALGSDKLEDLFWFGHFSKTNIKNHGKYFENNH